MTWLRFWASRLLYLLGHVWCDLCDGAAARHLSFHYAVYNRLMGWSADLDVESAVWAWGSAKMILSEAEEDLVRKNWESGIKRGQQLLARRKGNFNDLWDHPTS